MRTTPVSPICKLGKLGGSGRTAQQRPNPARRRDEGGPTGRESTAAMHMEAARRTRFMVAAAVALVVRRHGAPCSCGLASRRSERAPTSYSTQYQEARTSPCSNVNCLSLLSRPWTAPVA